MAAPAGNALLSVCGLVSRVRARGWRCLRVADTDGKLIAGNSLARPFEVDLRAAPARAVQPSITLTFHPQL